MKEIVTNLISKNRVRNQDASNSMNNTKPGDIYDLNTVTYVNRNVPEAFQSSGAPGYGRQRDGVMFKPEANTAMNLICTENSRKEFDYIVNQEYNFLREKQEMKEHQAEILKAKD